MIVAYALIGVAIGLLAMLLTRAVEPDALPADASVRRRLGLHRSRRVVAELSALFALDAFGGGFVVQSVNRRLVHLAGGLVLVVARQDQSTVEAAAERFEIERLVKEGAAQDRGFQGVVLLVGLSRLGGCLRSNLRPGRGIDSRRQAGPRTGCPS